MKRVLTGNFAAANLKASLASSSVTPAMVRAELDLEGVKPKKFLLQFKKLWRMLGAA